MRLRTLIVGRDRAEATVSCHTDKPPAVADAVYGLIERAAGTSLPIRIHAWDGSVAGPSDALLNLSLSSSRVFRRMLWSPGELGAARAYVAEEIDLTAADGDLLAVFSDPRIVAAASKARRTRAGRLALWFDLLALAADTGELRLPPPSPPEEAQIRGRIHSRPRDAAAISHHYDLGNDFYRLLLGSSMVYSCAYWTRDPSRTYTVDAARGTRRRVSSGALHDDTGSVGRQPR